MKKLKGKIILVDHLLYEKDLIEIALRQLEWDVEVEYFSNAEKALNYLKKTNDEIFLVISDMNMPKMDGLEFKKTIDKDKELLAKSIPFIFFSTTATREQVTEAYDYRVQGYFKKPFSVDDQAAQLDIIIKYWTIARRPNKEEVV